jgi:hypothetical protein
MANGSIPSHLSKEAFIFPMRMKSKPGDFTKNDSSSYVLPVQVIKGE